MFCLVHNWCIKIFTNMQAATLLKLWCTLLCKNLFSFMKSHLLIAGLNGYATVFCAESPFWSQWVQVHYLIPLLSDLEYLVWCWSLWSIYSLVLCRVINTNPLSFFYTSPSILMSTICWRCSLFSTMYLLASWQNIRCP